MSIFIVYLHHPFDQCPEHWCLTSCRLFSSRLSSSELELSSRLFCQPIWRQLQHSTSYPRKLVPSRRQTWHSFLRAQSSQSTSYNVLGKRPPAVDGSIRTTLRANELRRQAGMRSSLRKEAESKKPAHWRRTFSLWTVEVCYNLGAYLAPD